MRRHLPPSLASDVTQRWGRSYETLIVHVVGLTLAVAGLGIVASGLVDLWRGGPDVVVLLTIGDPPRRKKPAPHDLSRRSKWPIPRSS